MERLKQELEKAKREIRECLMVYELLVRGKGSLSDYLFITSNISVGLLVGYGIWG